MSDNSLESRIAEAQATISALQTELAETNRGLVALTLELEQRVDERTKELQARDAELKKTNTELLQLTAELKAANREILHANRLKSEFLANMSHELRTPLNAIIGFAQLMHDGKVGPVSSDHQEFLGDILTGARHLLHLINDVLDLAKVESGKVEFRPDTIQLQTLVSEICKVLQTLASRKGLTIDTEIHSAVEQVVVDSAKLKQVLYNYLSNAIKFTPEEGRIFVRILPEDSDHFRLEVADTGIGIRPEDLNKLFVEFQQLEGGMAKKHQGTGLGLALTKKIVELQGGRVGVRSKPGEGTAFYAVLPKTMTIKDTDHLADQQKEELTSSTKNLGLTVLIIDDDKSDHQLLRSTLLEAGYTTESVRLGSEAIAKTNVQAFSAILLDLILPDMSGWDVLHEIRSTVLNQRTPVIVVSVVAEQGIARSFPIQDYLNKPVSANALINALENACAQAAEGIERKILVLDDDPTALKVARVALRHVGYESICHTSGSRALAAASEAKFAAALVDLSMPEMDGFEFLDRFRQIPACEATPVIVWSEKDISFQDREKLNAGAQLVVHKGLDSVDVILRALKRPSVF